MHLLIMQTLKFAIQTEKSALEKSVQSEVGESQLIIKRIQIDRKQSLYKKPSRSTGVVL